MPKNIPIAKPIITNEELMAIEDVFKSGMLAQGKIVNEFENKFSEYTEVKNSIAISNGTVALDLTLKVLGIKNGDEVITTPFTFIATANAILYQRARPMFVDINEKTFNINPDNIIDKITQNTKAVIGVHLFGHPFDVKAIQDICEDHKLLLIEDCAQAHGAEYQERKVGSFGTGCFSFYPTKNITTGEGGMITTSDNDTTDLCRLLRNHGQSSKYFHTILGYNYRMTDIQAAIGIVQLKKLDEFNKKRIQNAEYLNENIDIEGIITPYRKNNVKHVYHQYVITIDENIINREKLIRYLISKGIGSAIHYPVPIYKQPLYQKLGFKENCPITERLANTVLSLPIHPSLKEEDLKNIANTINNYKETGGTK